jgi:hypothetical protein
MKKITVTNLKHIFQPEILSVAVFSLVGCLLVLGQFQRFQIGAKSGVYAHDILLFLYVVWSFVNVPAFWQKMPDYIWKKGRGELFLAGWIVVGILVNALGHGFSPTPLLYVFRLSVYGASLGLFWHFATTSQEIKERLRCITLGVGIGWAWFGFLQYFWMPDTRVLRFLGWDDHYYRLVSTLFDPGFTGILLVLALWYAASLIWKRGIEGGKWPVVMKAIQIGVIFFIGSAVLLTYSRSSYLAFGISAITLMVYFVWQKSFKQAVAIFVGSSIFLSALFFLPSPGGEGVKLNRTASGDARVNVIQYGLQQLQGYEWVVGEGIFSPSALPSQTPDYPDHSNVADSWVMFFLQGTGVVGLVLFSALALKYLLRAWGISPWLGASGVALLVHGLLNASLIYPLVVLYFGMLVISYRTVKE